MSSTHIPIPIPKIHSHPQIFWLVQNWNEIIAYNKITAINVIMNHRTSHAILWYMMKVQDAVVLRAFIIIIFFRRRSRCCSCCYNCSTNEWVWVVNFQSILNIECLCVRLCVWSFMFLSSFFISFWNSFLILSFFRVDPCTPHKPCRLIIDCCWFFLFIYTVFFLLSCGK